MTAPGAPASRRGDGPAGVLPVLLAALALSFLEIHLLVQVSVAQGVPEAAEKLYAVTVGRPDWREWQSRLAVPWLFRWAGEATGRGIAGVYLAGIALLHLAKNAVFGLTALRLSGARGTALRYQVYFSLATVALYDSLHRYPWDYLDMVLVSVLIAGIFLRKGPRFFTVLFLLALLNRESAFLVPAWMLLDAAVPDPAGGGDPRGRLAAAGQALALAACGIAATVLVRGRLLVEETAPLLLADPGRFRFPGALEVNLGYLLENWSDVPPGLGAGRVLAVLALPAVAAASWRQLELRERKVSLLAVATWLYIAAGASLAELRVHSLLLPFPLLVALRRFHGRPGAAGPEGGAA